LTGINALPSSPLSFLCKGYRTETLIRTAWRTLGGFNCDTPDRTCSSIDDHHPE
jgi:hypothetical protein